MRILLTIDSLPLTYFVHSDEDNCLEDEVRRLLALSLSLIVLCPRVFFSSYPRPCPRPCVCVPSLSLSLSLLSLLCDCGLSVFVFFSHSSHLLRFIVFSSSSDKHTQAHYTDATDEYTPLRPSARTASLLTEFSRLTLAEQSEFFASLGGLTGDAATREDMKRTAAMSGIPGKVGGGATADKVSYQPLAAFHSKNKVKVGLYGKEITAGVWADMVLFPGYTVFFKVRACARGSVLRVARRRAFAVESG